MRNIIIWAIFCLVVTLSAMIFGCSSVTVNADGTIDTWSMFSSDQKVVVIKNEQNQNKALIIGMDNDEIKKELDQAKINNTSINGFKVTPSIPPTYQMGK